jgi:glycine cleavage system H protein
MPPPGDLRYTTEHEWIRREPDDLLTMGITDYAAGALGDVVFVQLPAVGVTFSPGQPMGEVESTKSVSEVYAPLAGQVVERNDALDAQPDLINTDPFGAGWIVRMLPSDPAAYDNLMDADSYQALIS